MDKGYQKVFEPIIYPLNLRIIVGCDWEYLHNNFIFIHNDEYSKEDFGKKASAFVILVKNKKLQCDEVVVVFHEHENMTFRCICHESFHVATTYLGYLNMQMGYEIGQDEHPAYIAGWAGNCMGHVYNKIHDLKSKENGKEEKMVSK